MTTLIPFLARHDERVLHALVRRRRRALDVAMRAVTHLGDTAVIVALTLLLLSGIVQGTRPAGVEAAFALLVSHLLVQALKRGVGRPRPVLPTGCEFLAVAPDRFSFPSGHAAATLGLALVVAPLLAPPLAALALAAGVAVGVSRCYLGVHYPGDVLVGWALAVLGVLLARVLGAGALPV